MEGKEAQAIQRLDGCDSRAGACVPWISGICVTHFPSHPDSLLTSFFLSGLRDCHAILALPPTRGHVHLRLLGSLIGLSGGRRRE